MLGILLSGSVLISPSPYQLPVLWKWCTESTPNQWVARWYLPLLSFTAFVNHYINNCFQPPLSTTISTDMFNYQWLLWSCQLPLVLWLHQPLLQTSFSKHSWLKWQALTMGPPVPARTGKFQAFGYVRGHPSGEMNNAPTYPRSGYGSLSFMWLVWSLGSWWLVDGWLLLLMFNYLGLGIIRFSGFFWEFLNFHILITRDSPWIFLKCSEYPFKELT